MLYFCVPVSVDVGGGAVWAWYVRVSEHIRSCIMSHMTYHSIRACVCAHIISPQEVGTCPQEFLSGTCVTQLVMLGSPLAYTKSTLQLTSLQWGDRRMEVYNVDVCVGVWEWETWWWTVHSGLSSDGLHHQQLPARAHSPPGAEEPRRPFHQCPGAAVPSGPQLHGIEVCSVDCPRHLQWI